MLLAFLQSVVLSGAVVHTFVPGEVPRPLEVLVQDGRITALAAPGSEGSFPADARKVDCTGLHLVPGLIDGLVNHDPEHDRLYVAAGVTLVVDQGGELTPAMAERQLSARDRGPGPALWTAGAPMVGPAGATGVVLESVAAVDEKLPRVLGGNALDWIAIEPGLGTSVWKRLIERAHEKDLRVIGPVLASSSLLEVLDAKQDGLHHLDALLPAGKVWSTAKFEDFTARVERLASSATFLVPTLAVHAARILPPRTDGPELLHLSPIYVQQWVNDAAQRERIFTGEKGVELQRAGVAALELQSRLLRALHEQRAKLVPGSASPRPWLFPGRALVEEIVLWTRAGIPASEALRAATSGAAEHFGIQDRGVLAAGKIADLVGLAGDPESDVALLRDPKLVVLRGRVLAEAELDALTDDLRARQSALQGRVAGTEPIAIDPPRPVDGKLVARGAVEHRVQGLRLTVESWSVVEKTGGALVYSTRMRTFGGVSTADTDVHLEQTIENDRLIAFELEVTSGTLAVSTKGVMAAGNLNVEQRVGGQFVRNHPVRDRVVLVDVGSVLTPLLVAHHAREGSFKALFFDDHEPAVGTWELRVDEKENLLVRTHAGFLVAEIEASGVPGNVRRERGRGVADCVSTTRETPAGAWPIPPENRVPSKPAGTPR